MFVPSWVKSMFFFTVVWAVFSTYAEMSAMHINSIITRYGHFKVTPAVHSFHGNFILHL